MTGAASFADRRRLLQLETLYDLALKLHAERQEQELVDELLERVCAVLDPAATEELQQSWPFYVWDEGTGEVRWMCSWDTAEEDIDAFAADVRAVLSRSGRPRP